MLEIRAAALSIAISLSIPLSSAAQNRADSPGKSPVNTKMLVSSAWLADHLQDPDLVILCIASDQKFYSSGHIPGAHLLLLSEITEERGNTLHALPSPEKLRGTFENAGVRNDKRTILSGEGLGLYAARAYFTLDFLGLGDRAALLDGGIETWKLEYRPMTTADPPAPRGSLTLRVRPERLVEFEELQRLTVAKDADAGGLTLLDARPVEEYTGQRISQDVPRAGHIPGARCLYWMNLLVSRENPVLKPARELRRLYEEAGARPGARVVTYCRTGMQSSMDYFVAKYLGYDARVYAASFYEWGRTDAPVSTGEK